MLECFNFLIRLGKLRPQLSDFVGLREDVVEVEDEADHWLSPLESEGFSVARRCASTVSCTVPSCERANFRWIST